MEYIKTLVSRYLFAVFLALFPGLYYLVFTPLTLYLSFLIMKLYYSASLSGNIITIGVQQLEFIPACTAASAYLLLSLLILLTKDISLKKGIALFLYGSALILVANLIRIEILVIILLEKGINYFETLHLFFWKVLASLYVAFVWILLIKKYKIKNTPIYSDFVYLRKFIKK